MHTPNPTRPLRAGGRILFVVGVAMLAGCVDGGPPAGTVEGTVTYRDKAFTDGDVNFVMPAKGVAAIGKIDPTGKYAIDTPLEAGTYMVYLTPPQMSAEEGPKPGGAAKKMSTGIPKKFREAATSGISVTVKEGKQVIPIEMKD